MSTPVFGVESEAMRTRWIIGLLLAIGAACLFAHTMRFDFVAWDDGIYVTDNPFVRAGVTSEGLCWSITATDGGIWHPVVWWSLMLNAQWFGVDSTGFHATNVLLHAVNALLLFLLLSAATGSTWRSALVAALWAVHPLRVESVAWVSERKDLLHALFGFLALWAYVSYAQRGSIARYALVVVMFVLALMCKPMWVTLPAALLLLDIWPLRRTPWLFASQAAAPGPPECAPRSWVFLVLEKLPLLVISVVFSVVAVMTQAKGGAVIGLDQSPIGMRIANAIASTVRYLGHMFWPADLAPFYPHPRLIGSEPWPIWAVGLGLTLLLTITALAIGLGRRRPYLPVGWLWYLGTLVPVIGLVAVGNQAMADRFTYIPMIGLLVGVVWGASHAAGLGEMQRLGGRRVAAVAVAVTVIVALSAMMWQHSRIWRDSVALFEHATARYPDVPMLQANLGKAYWQRGEHTRAMQQFRRSLDLNDQQPLVLYDLAVGYKRLGQIDSAESCAQAALNLNGDLAIAHNLLGSIRLAEDDLVGAAACYQRAIDANPDDARGFYRLGVVEARRGRRAEAESLWRHALQLNPFFADARYNLALLLRDTGRMDDAVMELEWAARHDPRNARLWRALGNICMASDRARPAADAFERWVRLSPDDPDARERLGLALARLGRINDAMIQYQVALRLDGRRASTLNALGEAYVRAGQLAAAVDAFQAALEINPDLDIARRRLDHIQQQLQPDATRPDESPKSDRTRGVAPIE